MSRFKGELALLATAVIWGTGFVGVDVALNSFTSFQVTALRFFISAILLSVIFFKKLIKLDKTTIRYGAVLGTLLFLGFAFQTKGMVYTTPAKNAFITGVNVVIVPFIGIIAYRRKIDAHALIGAALALTGIGVLSLRLDSAVNIGDVLTLICAFCFAMHIFFTAEFMANGMDTISILLVQMITSFLLSLAGIFVFGETDFSQATLSGLAVLVYLGVFSTTVCFFLQTWGQKYTTETKAAIFLSMESVFGALFSVIILSEQLTARMLAGCAMILAAILIAELKPRFRQKGVN